MRFFEFRSLITEADFSLRSEKGEIAFRKSKIDDPHIISAINKLSQNLGISIDDITNSIKVEMDLIEKIREYSPILADVDANNAAERAIWNIISNASPEKTRTEFDEAIFNDLENKILEENSAGSLLKSADPSLSKQLLGRLSPVMLPSHLKEYEKYNYIETAAVSDKGVFFFSVPFMERLLYCGDLLDVKPPNNLPGRKYVEYGGDIPNSYCYIEFLILHEMQHFKFGDAMKSKKYAQYGHRMNNLAQDFIINFVLTKMGYVPLPLGLFSDDLNQDRFSSYPRLLKKVKEEIDKLPAPLQTWFEQSNKTEDHGDPASSGEGSKEPWRPLIDDIVLINNRGIFGRVVSVKPIDMYEIEPMTWEEVEKAYPGIKQKKG